MPTTKRATEYLSRLTCPSKRCLLNADVAWAVIYPVCFMSAYVDFATFSARFARGTPA